MSEIFHTCEGSLLHEYFLQSATRAWKLLCQRLRLIRTSRYVRIPLGKLSSSVNGV